jgi:hypothetical protein
MALPLEGLHSRFRTLLKLTELVTAINNSGHPTLRYFRTAAHKTNVADNLLLAISTILVRNNEVVAVGISGSNVVAMQEQPVESQPVALPFDEDLECGDMGVEGVAAVVKPRKEDSYVFPDDRCCIFVSEGKSLLPEPQYQGNMWDHFHAKR